MTVEQAAIATATAYAEANGYDPDDRRAIGLVLAGMAIAAAASVEARKELVAGYLRELPQAEAAIRGWADRLVEGNAVLASPVTGDSRPEWCETCGYDIGSRLPHQHGDSRQSEGLPPIGLAPLDALQSIATHSSDPGSRWVARQALAVAAPKEEPRG